MGQRNFYRAIRLLMYEARFDVLNEPATNGEHYIQRVVLLHTSHSIVFDIGAHRGDWTASLLKQRNTDIAVYAFEPSEEIFDILRQRTADSKSVIPVHMACSERVGKSKFIVPGPLSGIRSIAAQDSHSDSDLDIEMVTLTSVDRYCRENGIPHINLLKVDTEGHDLSVLLGAEDTLRAHSVDVVQFEYNHRWIYERRFLRDAFEHLKPLGYAIGKITGMLYSSTPTGTRNWRRTARPITLRAHRNGLIISTRYRLDGCLTNPHVCCGSHAGFR